MSPKPPPCAIVLAMLAAGCASSSDHQEPALVSVPAIAEFWAGSREHPPREKVRIAAFRISPCETTQGLFEAVMGRNPSVGAHSPELPVQNVSWFDAVNFCNALSQREGKQPCYRTIAPGRFECDFSKDGFRLPTSGEWEYACRGGQEKPYFWGDRKDETYCAPPLTPEALGKLENAVKHSFARPVKTRKGNWLGLHDMAGNVAEWCQDSPMDRPGARIVRGGSWENHDWEAFQSKWKSSMPAGEAAPTVGFRFVAREIE